VATIYLVRHGRTPANEKGILAGRTKGIFLDDLGILQAQEVAKKLQDTEFKKIIVSPMERCQQTVKIILAGLEKSIKPVIESGINECNYGDWSNKKLSVLRKKPLWRITIDPCSISIIKVENDCVQVVSINNRVNVKQPQKKRKRLGSDLGGGAG